jgi:hypothetical protein
MTERETKDKLDAALDETLDESFPASDPPANTIETGVAGSPQDNAGHDNKEARRFEPKSPS